MRAPEIAISLADAETRERILKRIPQQSPFRFVDSLDELGEVCASGSYRFRADESFYAGHFPGEPLTPGVILIECMAQIALVPLALYLSEAKAAGDSRGSSTLPVFAEVDQAEFSAPVRPGERVFVRGERIYYRRGKLKCRVEMRAESGAVIASAVLAGIAVSPESIR